MNPPEQIDEYKDVQFSFCGATVNNHSEFLKVIHSIVEDYLVASKGIDQMEINTFDESFDEVITMFPDVFKDKEPGNNDACPYRKEHGIATRIEEWLANVLHIELAPR